MSHPWFRMYSEFLHDPKVQMLSEADQRRFIMVLCLRCGNGDVTLQDDAVAFQLRITLDEWTATKAVLVGRGMIDADNKPTNWNKRQFVSDSSKDRVSRHRAKLKQEGHDDVTLQKRPQTQIQIQIQKESPVQSTEQEPARTEPALNKAEQVLDIGSKVKLGAAALPQTKPSALDKLITQAEKFGLDVADILEKIAKTKPDRPEAYFVTLAVNQLKSKAPLLTDAVHKAAMRGERLAVGAVFQALLEPAR